MAFWENLGETITAKSKEVADKAKAFTDIASLKGQIVTQESAILRYYKEIGREYYAAHKDDADAECLDKFEAIKKAENIIEELQKKIAELSKTKRCNVCDSNVPDDSAFCPRCGAKFEEEDTFFDEEDTDDVVVAEMVDDDDILDEESVETVVSEE